MSRVPEPKRLYTTVGKLSWGLDQGSRITVYNFDDARNGKSTSVIHVYVYRYT